MLWIRQPSTCVPLSSLGVVSHDEIDGENAVVARLARQHPRLHHLPGTRFSTEMVKVCVG